jgi:hypothetical protein
MYARLLCDRATNRSPAHHLQTAPRFISAVGIVLLLLICCCCRSVEIESLAEGVDLSRALMHCIGSVHY